MTQRATTGLLTNKFENMLYISAPMNPPIKAPIRKTPILDHF